MMVLVILVDFTTPERIRPRIETSPVKGHFLSTDMDPDDDNDDQSPSYTTA